MSWKSCWALHINNISTSGSKSETQHEMECCQSCQHLKSDMVEGCSGSSQQVQSQFSTIFFFCPGKTSKTTSWVEFYYPLLKRLDREHPPPTQSPALQITAPIGQLCSSLSVIHVLLVVKGPGQWSTFKGCLVCVCVCVQRMCTTAHLSV